MSDDGKCFVGIEKKPKGQDTPTVFESELIDHGISLMIFSPQRKGKLGRLHRTMEDEIWHYKSLSEYVEYYNERRLHFSLDIKTRETALRTFYNRTATKNTRKSDLKWMSMIKRYDFDILQRRIFSNISNFVIVVFCLIWKIFFLFHLHVNLIL